MKTQIHSMKIIHRSDVMVGVPTGERGYSKELWYNETFPQFISV